MANQKTWGINKISFYAIGTVAVLYILAVVFKFIGLNLTIISVLQNLATALMIGVVAVLAWNYVANKALVWKILYLVCLLVVIAGIIIPLVM